MSNIVPSKANTSNTRYVQFLMRHSGASPAPSESTMGLVEIKATHSLADEFHMQMFVLLLLSLFFVFNIQFI